MPAKLTTEKFIEKCILKHGNKFDYSKLEYLGNDKSVTIICKVHGEFKQRANDHLSKGAGCPKCAGVAKLTQEEFVSRVKKLHDYDFSKSVYKGSDKKVTVVCTVHGEFKTTPHSLLSGHGCDKCSGTHTISKEEFIKRSKEKFGRTFDYSKVNYINYKTPVTLTHEVLGDFIMTPSNHLLSSTGLNAEFYNVPSSPEHVIKRAMDVHGDYYGYGYVELTYMTNKEDMLIVCPKHGPFWQSPHNHYKGSGCFKCSTYKSKPEELLLEMLSNFKVESRTRKVITPKELDIYLPDNNVAIEVNGIFHHSEDKVDKYYHKNKTESCATLGIRLFHITCADIYKKSNIVKSMIENACGKSERIFARKCIVCKVGFSEYSEFFCNNHISGNIPAKVAYGLFFGDDLISVMSFGKPRFGAEHDWEIYRFATKCGKSVVGGASKLFNKFVEDNNPKSVMTFADLRYGKGRVYEKCGFVFERFTDVGFTYHHKNGTILSRLSTQKYKLPKLLGDKFDENMSARDNLRNAGYLKHFDCGNAVYVWRP